MRQDFARNKVIALPALLALPAVLALIASPAPATAQEPEAAALGPTQLAERFFEQVAAGEHARAIDELYSSNQWVSSISDQVGKLRAQFVGLNDLVGGYLGSEAVGDSAISSRFVYLWYIGYFERQPLQFHFSFYRAKDQWRVYSFSYDEGMDAVVKELAKMELAYGVSMSPPGAAREAALGVQSP